MLAQKALRARDRKYSVLTHAPFGFISFLLLLKCRQLKKKLSPAFMHARTILLIQIKKSLATDAIYCCSLFKHLTLFAGRTRKRNLCQREQFESKSLRAQYVSHLFIQAARQGSPHSADFSHTEPCYTANFVFGEQLWIRVQIYFIPPLFFLAFAADAAAFCFLRHSPEASFRLLLERASKKHHAESTRETLILAFQY